MTPHELKARTEQIRWFHTIDLGNGVVTRGVDNTPRKLAEIRMPNDLSGQSVLDIGAWDGFFSFEAERRGATRVLAVDSYCWSGAGWGTQAGFNLAREVFHSRVEDRRMEVLELSPDAIGTFDLVLFLGVLYHLRHPLLALEKVAAVTRGQLILETEVDLIHVRAPAMAFYPGTELNGDPTNWWAPNPRALCDMIRVAGFSRVEVVRPPRPGWVRILRSLREWARDGKRPWQEWSRDRMVVHAWK